MVVTSDNLLFCGCDAHAENDADPQGGAVDLAKRVAFPGGEMTGPGTLDLEADEAISGTWRVSGRRGTTLVEEDYVFAAATLVKGVETFDYVLKVVRTDGALNPTATLCVFEHSSGLALCYLYGSGVDVAGVEVTEVRRLFIGATLPAVASPPADLVRYEKVFVANLSGTDTLTDGLGLETADPGSLFDFALASAVNDVESTLNRLTAPLVVGSFDSQDKSLPANLAPGDVLGVWARYTLAEDGETGKTRYNQQVKGKAFL